MTSRASGDAYERVDGIVTKIGRHPLASLALILGVFLTDGALAMVMDALPNELANPPNAPIDDQTGGAYRPTQAPDRMMGLLMGMRQ
jgi:hypothetical protein